MNETITFLKIRKIAKTITTINGDDGLLKKKRFQVPTLRPDKSWYQYTPLNPGTPINTTKNEIIPATIDQLKTLLVILVLAKNIPQAK